MFKIGDKVKINNLYPGIEKGQVGKIIYLASDSLLPATNLNFIPVILDNECEVSFFYKDELTLIARKSKLPEWF